MLIVTAPTEDFIKIERTVLDADVSAGTDVSLTLQNNDNLSDNDFIVVGREGSESAELQQINAVVTVGVTVQVATLLFAHKKGEPVTKYRYNKRGIYGSTTKEGTYTEITADGSPITIQVDDPQSAILEYTGVEGYIYFKGTYFNSEESLETDVATAVILTASQELTRYTSLYSIRVQAGLTENPYINDGRIERKRKQAENEINSAIFSRYTLPLAEVPPLIQHICELLAGGYLDFEQFGPEGEGVKWLGEARALLKSIQKGTQRLIGLDNTELSFITTTNVLQGFPDNDGVGDADTPERAFTVDKEY